MAKSRTLNNFFVVLILIVSLILWDQNGPWWQVGLILFAIKFGAWDKIESTISDMIDLPKPMVRMGLGFIALILLALFLL